MKTLSYKYYFYLLMTGLFVLLCEEAVPNDKAFFPTIFFTLWLVFSPIVITILLFKHWLFYLTVSALTFFVLTVFINSVFIVTAAYSGVMLGIMIRHFFPEVKLAREAKG
ncbi:hypothetical protein [Methylophilus sp. Leaf414]|uniref:hypothetical protein n=1 Tax=Methylophilus sp. Leaf414 TaxID=1736371 RepID=UPI0006F23A73|nr:hypothetical protein [Methylophilus sp. Leaf414]KQT38207.1 hypothetical protein ASG24_04440 [Methylophilus sp. Leaf414]